MPWRKAPYPRIAVKAWESSWGDEFAARAGELAAPRGDEKTAAIVRAIEQCSGPFAISDIQNACPGVSVDMFRRSWLMDEEIRIVGGEGK